MNYRQLLKCTKKYVRNQPFREYLFKFYKANAKGKFDQEGLKTWGKLLQVISQKRQQKEMQGKVQPNLNINYSFIKQKCFFCTKDELLEGANQEFCEYFQKAMKVYMLCQLCFSYQQSSIFPKRIGEIKKNFQTLMKSEKRFLWGQNEKIYFP